MFKKLLLWLTVILLLSGIAVQALADDPLFFGHDPQSGEPIEWMILTRYEDRALLLSRYVLAAQPYNDVVCDVDWVMSSVREWLNSIFLREAFTDAERAAILITTVDNRAAQGNPEWSRNEGILTTKDALFLLSHKEVCDLFPLESDRIAQPLSSGEQPNATFWWIRSSGPDPYTGAGVSATGVLGNTEVLDIPAGVRPALWLDMTKAFPAD